MTKELHNAIMKRPRYRNKFFKGKCQTNRENYKIQRSFCKKLLRKTKKMYFSSLNTKKKISDNRTFWRTIVPLFTKKAAEGEKIVLNEAEKHISDDTKILKIFDNFFSNVVTDLKIPNHCNYFSKKTKKTFSLNSQ